MDNRVEAEMRRLGRVELPDLDDFALQSMGRIDLFGELPAAEVL